MRIAVLACLAFSLSAQPLLAADEYPADLMKRKEVSVLKPLNQWNIDYGENLCRLSRLFGTSETPHLLYIEQSAPTHFFSLAIAGPEVAKVQRDSLLKLGLADDQIARAVGGSSADFGTIGRGIIAKNVRLRESPPAEAGEVRALSGRLDPREAKAIRRIVLARSNRAVAFETGELDGAADALNACTNDLLASWGLSPEKHRQYRPPKMLNIEAITKRILSVYPRKAALNDEQGDVSVRLIVDADGTVADCVIAGLTANDALKPELCKFLREARLEAAQAADGQLMKSFFVVPIAYRLF